MREVGARYARVILLTRFGHSSEAWSSVIVIKSLGSPMGRGQLKYRRRGRGKGGGGRSGGNGPDDSVGIKEGTRDIAIFLRDTAVRKRFTVQIVRRRKWDWVRGALQPCSPTQKRIQLLLAI